MTASKAEGSRRDAARLVCFAAASLYLELACIRFCAAEVLYLGYFSNFILISAFVGLGIGFLAAKRNISIGGTVPFFLLFLFALVLVSVFDADILRNRFGLFFFGNVKGRAGLPGAVLLLALFLAVAGMFAGIGQLIGGVFDRFSALKAYTLDIAGSLLGIIAFSVQSASWSGPVVWVGTGGMLLVLGHLLEPNDQGGRPAAAIAVSACCAILLLLSSDKGHTTVWSTYQKLEYVTGPYGEPQQWTRGDRKHIYANGIFHQIISPVEVARKGFYGLPYQFQTERGEPVGDVLIIGAGSGTDVSVALAEGAASVDAVEIDAGILEIGRTFNDAKPYDDPRVTAFATDGRAFVRSVDKKYDVIVYALPDSLIRASSMTSVRLESYLFTQESFAEVREHLKPGGLFVMYNQYRWSWLVDKIATMLETSFGHAPRIVTSGETTLLAVGLRDDGHERTHQPFAEPATDDWPFVYMKSPRIHWLYIGMIGTFLLASFLGVLVLAPPGTLRNPDGPFFFMGAAFLLLETKSISLFSLLFGTTWLVNSLAFGGVLTSVLLANLVVQRFKITNREILFVMLLGVLVAAYLVPSGALLSITSPALRYGAAVLLVFSPIFFANLIFSREFRDTDESTSAFGWNLLGAVAGGGLEYLSLLMGHRNLLWIVAGCYVLVAVLLRRKQA